MFPPRPLSPPQRCASCPTDDQSSTKDKPSKLLQHHYTHDLSVSSHSLATTHFYHDDSPTPSMPTHVSHTTSVPSTPMTSPSTGYSSIFHGSLSSATSEFAPSAESKYRSEFGMLIPGSSSVCSPTRGSASSRSSHPVSSRSKSTIESDPQSSAPHIPRKHPPGYLSNRPLTAPTDSLPVLASSSSADSSPADHHTRSHSRLTVSIKNLFFRQAIPSPSRFSFNSATTTPPDSEASSSSFHVPATAGKWSATSRKTRPPDLEISGSVTPALPNPDRGANALIDAHRRYASEAAAKIYNARTGSGQPTSQDSIDVSFRNTQPTRGRDPKTRNVLRRRPSGSAKLLKARDRGMSSPSRPNDGDADRLRLPPKEGMSRQGGVPFPLTPAGAVAEAYKQLELHRDDTPSPPKLSMDDQMSSTASHDGGHDRDHPEHSPTPYYTVFGSERRVRAGGPDDRWAGFQPHCTFTPSQVTPSHHPSMSDPGGRSLTRKLSSRWRKVKGGVLPEESPSREKGHSKGRPSLQDIWGGDKSTVRATGQSIDGVPNSRGGAFARPTANHARSDSKGNKSEGPKLWQLMRRISTGGLRDRFQSDKTVPPVPAIPKEVLKKMNGSQRDNEPLSTSQHHPSPSLARPSAATSSSSPNSSDVASAQFFKTHSTRSSVSSYGEAVVVPRVAEPTLDRHIITPLEQLRLADNHVEGGEPNTSCVPVPRSPRRSTSVPAGLGTVEDGEGDHLPLLSPRRQTCSGESPSSGSSRPCSTSPSAPGSARASYQGPGVVPGPSRMADGIVSLSPPPRSSRNSARGGSVASSLSHSVVTKQADASTGIRVGGARQMDRTPSSRSDMTARVESPEPGGSQGRDQDQDALPSTRKHITYRELGAPRKPPLSEREKADIWNDLLARSDKAGGTLHINGAAELLSDNMRLSMHSECS